MLRLPVRVPAPLFCDDSPLTECVNGESRLTGGAGSLEGRVEICVDNVYRTACDDLWDESEARVVCSQLGYTGPGTYIPTQSMALTALLL